jgi:hypothetical protein
MTEIAFKIELLFGERVCGALETITPMECQKGKYPSATIDNKSGKYAC